MAHENSCSGLVVLFSQTLQLQTNPAAWSRLLWFVLFCKFGGSSLIILVLRPVCAFISATFLLWGCVWTHRYCDGTHPVSAHAKPDSQQTPAVANSCHHPENSWMSVGKEKTPINHCILSNIYCIYNQIDNSCTYRLLASITTHTHTYTPFLALYGSTYPDPVPSKGRGKYRAVTDR